MRREPLQARWPLLSRGSVGGQSEAASAAAACPSGRQDGIARRTL